MVSHTSAPGENVRLRLDWRIAVLSAFSALIGALLGALVAYAGTVHQGRTEDERALREYRAQTYSSLLSALIAYEGSITRAEVRAQGGGVEEEWNLMRREYSAVLDAASVVKIIGSPEVTRPAEALEDSATVIRDQLDQLNMARHGSWKVKSEIDGRLKAVTSTEKAYVTACRRDLVPTGVSWLP